MSRWRDAAMMLGGACVLLWSMPVAAMDARELMAGQVALLPPPVLTDAQPVTEAPAPTAPTDPTAQADMVALPVLTRDLPAGTVVQASDLSDGMVPRVRAFAGLMREPGAIVGQQVTRALKSGDPVARIHLKTVPVVANGSLVQLVYRKGGIELTGQGKALQDGQTGETVRVLNPDTRATLLATVTAPGVVDLQ